APLRDLPKVIMLPSTMTNGHAAPADNCDQAQHPAADMVPEPATVLIVDDAEVNRALLADYLELMGHRSVSAQDGAEGLAMAQALRPDLILLDLMMPVMDGHTLLQRLQEDDTLRSIPVVVISGKDDDQSLVRCIENGAEDY